MMLSCGEAYAYRPQIVERVTTRHRADIDGLRAMAVIPVVLFHAGVPGNPGGFLGVDVFFVISGFLITSILLREAVEGRFSIIAFYNRRIRRIFPALFVMLALVTVAALFLLAPGSLVRFGRSLLATTLFVSNIAFFRETGYFTTSALEKPLLHTWSLAVEEQFYLVWPVVLWAVLRLGGRRALSPVILIASGASFLLAILGSYWNAPATFFLPMTRAWELGIGAALATLPPLHCRPRVREAGGIIGLVALLAAFMLSNEDTPMFVASGVACFGTAVLIAFNREPTLASRFLSLPPIVGVGLISYSLYLWHWPLLAFAHYYFDPGDPPTVVRALLIVSAIGLAILSWFFVEQPLRRPGKPGRAFAVSAAVMLLLGGIGLVLYLARGLPDRVEPRVAQLERLTQRPETFCAGCSIGPAGSPEIVVWGDSHAAAMAPAVAALAAERQMPAVVFTMGGCPPFDGAASRLSGCRAFQRKSLESISRLRDVRLVILASRWALYTEPALVGRPGAKEASQRFLRDSLTRTSSLSDSRRAFTAAVPRTVATIKRALPNATIVLIGQFPEPGFDPAECMIRAAMFNRDISPCEVASPRARSPVMMGNATIGSVATRDPRVRAIYLDRLTCDRGLCRTAVNGLPLYSDINHLSPAGAVLLLKDCLNAIAAGSRCDDDER